MSSLYSKYISRENNCSEVYVYRNCVLNSYLHLFHKTSMSHVDNGNETLKPCMFFKLQQHKRVYIKLKHVDWEQSHLKVYPRAFYTNDFHEVKFWNMINLINKCFFTIESLILFHNINSNKIALKVGT